MSNMKKHDENKFYQEYICRAVIEKIKPDLNFVKFESPDFFDTKKEIGMEVTIAEVANSYSNSMKYAKLKSGRFRDCEKATRELLKNGKMTKAGYILNSFDPDPCDSICKGVNKKMKKLESWFYNYKKHWLVLSLKMPLYEYTEKIRNVVVKENIDKEFYFDKKAKDHVFRKCFYKQPGDRVDFFDNASKALGIVFLRFQTPEETCFFMDHAGEHIQAVLV